MTNAADDFQLRTRMLLGEARLARLRHAHVLVLGLGGVGGYALEQLTRAGVGRLTIVDGDRIEASNRNRQLIALCSTTGELKTDAWEKRLLDINPALEIVKKSVFIAEPDLDGLLADRPDFAVDAIDSVGPKVAFILACRARGIPLISSMGSGGRSDPLQLRECDIAKTSNCALARAVRTRLRHLGVERGVRVIFSPEPVPEEAVAHRDADGCRPGTVGTLPMVPAAFGTACAAAALRFLLTPETE